MRVSDLFLSNAGWLFLTPWSLLVVAIGVATFGRDLFPSKAQVESHSKASASSPASRSPR
ncbi:MAG TPA: hypothetical protein VKQ11_10040 [Candidatus Sulfotelmatobacter sp.]|nr:hypothetical protein [Candidatus Sulfotelmatobacter sp.]